MNTPSIRLVLNIKLMLLSIMHIINLMNRKLGNQLGLFCSSASGLMCAPSQPARRASRGPCRRRLQLANNSRQPRWRRFSQPWGISRAWLCTCPQLSACARSWLVRTWIRSRRAWQPLPTGPLPLPAHACACGDWPAPPARTPPCAYGDVGVTRSVKISPSLPTM
jgi:hypothetical protein